MSEKKNTLGIHFGALCPKIAQQIKDQGYHIDRASLSCYQKDADAITRLKIRGLIPDSQAEQLRRRLLSVIVAACRPIKEKR